MKKPDGQAILSALFAALALSILAAGIFFLESRRTPGKGVDPPSGQGSPAEPPTSSAPRIAVLVGDPDRHFDADYTLLARTLAEAGMPAAEISLGAPIPADTDLLLVLGGHGLGLGDTDRIKGFRASGGAVFMALKGVDVSTGDTLAARALPEAPVDGFLAGAGISVERGLVLDRAAVPAPFQAAGEQDARLYPYHHWFSVDATIPSGKASIPLRFFWPSALRVEPQVRGAAVVARAGPGARMMKGEYLLDPPGSLEWFGSGRGTGAASAPLAVVLPRDALSGLGPLFVSGSADIAGDLVLETEAGANMDFLLATIRIMAGGLSAPAP